MKKKVIIISLIFVLFLMSVGYSVYSGILKINGTSNIDSNFLVEVTNIKEESKSGKAVSVTEPTYTKSTASFNAKLSRPGDNIEYEVTLSNNGTIDSKINNIVITNPSSIIKVETRGISKGQILKSGENLKYIVRVYIDKNSKITEDVTEKIEVSTDLIQDDNQIFNEGVDGVTSSKLEIKSISLTSSYTSITSNISAKGEGLKYYYSLDNENFVEGSSSYTFNNLEINKRYTIYYKIEDSKNNYVTESRYINTKDLDDSVITVENEEEWTTSKKVTISFPSVSGAKYYYKVGDNDYIETTSTKELTLSENTTIYIKMELGSSTFESEKEITKIDSSNPEVSLTASKTTNSITVVANTSSISGISKYEFSIDGETWIDNKTYNNYTFKNLTHDTDYEIYARVTNNSNLNFVSNIGVKTNKINSPTFNEETIGIVEITYPEGCGDSLICSYIKNDTEVSVTSKTIKVSFSDNGTLVAKVTDGTNYVTSASYTVIVKRQVEYSYSSSSTYNTYTAFKDGYYKIELWGAQGGKAICNGSACGSNSMGGYSSGEIYLEKGEVLYVYLGGKGADAVASSNSTGGYNGGGNGTWDNSDDESAGAGGGATDVRLVSGTWNNSDSLKSRIMVAGGGGGSSWTYSGGAGGGLLGADAGNNGGYQKSGNAFGIGQNGSGSGDSNGVAGGGGGYYGGLTDISGTNNSAGGGSGFISGYAGVNAVNSSKTHTNNTLHYSNKYFINNKMYSGINSGEGKAKITYLDNPSSNDSEKFKKVRYIKDCINGSSSNSSNHWIEIEAINKGVNVAKGKTVTGDFEDCTSDGSGTFATITDGIVDSTSGSDYTDGCGNKGKQCVTVDLGTEYDLEEIAVWHYYADGRTYKENTVSIASSNNNFREIYNEEKAETSEGNHIVFDSLKPTFEEDFDGTKTDVTIVFPDGCGSSYTCEYSIDGNSIISVTSNKVNLSFTKNAKIVANVKSNNSIIATNTHSVEGNNLYVSNSGSDTEGLGTKEKPFATIQKAYNSAKSNAVIYIMDEISIQSATKFNSNKKIKITSDGTNAKSVKKTKAFDNFSFIVSSGSLTLENIIFDGASISDTKGCFIIGNSASVTVEDGTVVKNFIGTEANGGAFRLSDWQSIMSKEGGSAASIVVNGGQITNNQAYGGSGIHGDVYSSITINGGEISSNNTTGNGGGIYSSGQIIVNGGEIKNNNADKDGGGIYSVKNFTLNGGEISNNDAAYGGGVYVAEPDSGANSVMNIYGGSIMNNYSTKNYTNDISSYKNKSWGGSPNVTINDYTSDFSFSDSKTYKITSAVNDTLDIVVYNASTTNGTNLIGWNNSTDTNGLWNPYVMSVENGQTYYYFYSSLTYGRFIGPASNSYSSGTLAVIQDAGVLAEYSTHMGKWTLESLGNNYYRVKNKNGLCLDVAGGSTSNNTNIQLASCNSNNAQKWKFTPSTAEVTNSISMSSWKSSKGSYQTCYSSNWEDYSYNFNISISGGSVSSGKMCYASSSSSSSSYCGTYNTNAKTGYGTACFNSSTNWVYYRSSACAYAYVVGTHGLSTSRYQC